MLTSTSENLPISLLEWELMAQSHKAVHPGQEHWRDQLKKRRSRSSQRLRWGWDIPPCEAKEIQKLIVEKSEIVTDSEDESFAADSGEKFSKEEERVNGASKVAMDKAANDNAVVGGFNR